MMGPQLLAIVQTVIGRVVNSLPEGLLIALFAWILLRLLPRQNSGTRFAVWFVALLAVAALPVAGLDWMSGGGPRLTALAGEKRPWLTLSGPWGVVLFAVWTVAAAVAMLRLAGGLWRLRELRKNCVAVDTAELEPSIRETVAAFSPSRSVTLATSDQVSVPAAIGFFRPMIVLPAWALRELPAEELNTILLHEFAHLQRWDDWTNLLQKLVRAIFFFHPAVWWIENRLSLEREMACDDQVLAETGNPRGYAKCLIALLEKSMVRRSWAMAQAAVHRAREASLRVARILDVNRANSSRVWKPALAVVGVFSVACLVIVPRAPQFVGFAVDAPVIQANVQAASPVQLPASFVVPAAMNTASLPSTEKAPSKVARRAKAVQKHAVEPQQATPQELATFWSGDGEPGLPDFLNVAADEAVAPSQTLLVVRTTLRTMQSVGENSMQWSVSVWRIILVNPAQNVDGRAPAAKKT